MAVPALLGLDDDSLIQLCHEFHTPRRQTPRETSVEDIPLMDSPTSPATYGTLNTVLVNFIQKDHPERKLVKTSDHIAVRFTEDHPAKDLDAEEEAIHMPTEVFRMLQLSFPIALGRVGNYITASNYLLLLSRLGTRYIAATTLATQIMYLGYEVLFGLTMPINSLVAQAMGARKPQKAGIWVRCAYMWVTGAAIPITLSYFIFAREMLSVFVTDEETIEAAVLCVRITVLYPFFWPWFAIAKNFARGLQEMTGNLWAGLFAALFSFWACLFSMFGIPYTGFHGLGFAGYGLGFMLTVVLEIAVFCLWTFGWRQVHRKHNVTFDKAPSRKHHKAYLELAIPGVVTSVAQVAAGAILVLFSARLGNHCVSTISVLNALKKLIQTVFVGSSLQVRCAKLLLINHEQAKQLFWVCFIVMVSASVALSFLCCYLRTSIAYVYTNDDMLRYKIVHHMPLMLTDLVLTVAVNYLQNGLQAIGKNKGFAASKLLAGWVIQLPVGLYLMFWSDLFSGETAYRMAIIVGDVARLVPMLLLMLRADWHKQCRKAQERLRHST